MNVRHKFFIEFYFNQRYSCLYLVTRVDFYLCVAFFDVLIKNYHNFARNLENQKSFSSYQAHPCSHGIN